MKKSRRRSPKAVLRLPDLEHAKSAVLNSLPSPESRRSYEFAIQNFVHWYCSEPRLALNRIFVTRYRMQLEQLHLAASTINQRLAAVRRLAYEASDAGLLSPELAAGIKRVRGVKQLGVRIGNWLTAEQGRALVDAPVDPDSSRKTRSRHPRSALGMRPSPIRTRSPEAGRCSAAGRPLGHRRSDWQGRTRSYGAGFWLGEETNR